MSALSAVTLKVRCFGSFYARSDGQPLFLKRPHMEYQLLAYLALHHGCPVSREVVSRTFWPTSENRLYYLRRTLSSLRSALGFASDRLSAPERQTLCLTLAPADDADLLAFDRLLQQGDPTSLDAALALYTGPLLDGWDAPWVRSARETYRAKYVQALERRKTIALAERDHPRVRALLHRLAEAGAFREADWIDLANLYCEEGFHHAAYETCQELRRYLGSNGGPSPAVREVLARIPLSVRGNGSGRLSLRPAANTSPADPSRPLVVAPDFSRWLSRVEETVRRGDLSILDSPDLQACFPFWSGILPALCDLLLKLLWTEEDAVPKEARPYLLQKIASYSGPTQRYDLVRACGNEALRLFQENHPPRERLHTLWTLCDNARFQNAHHEAWDYVLQLERLARQTHEPFYLAQALREQANILVSCGHHAPAEERLHQAQRLFEEVGSPLYTAATLAERGTNYALAGEEREGLRWTERALEYAVQNEEANLACATDYGMGSTFLPHALTADTFALVRRFCVHYLEEAHGKGHLHTVRGLLKNFAQLESEIGRKLSLPVWRWGVRAARLWGASVALQKRMDWPETRDAGLLWSVGEARLALGERDYLKEAFIGSQMSWQEAAEFALEGC